MCARARVVVRLCVVLHCVCERVVLVYNPSVRGVSCGVMLWHGAGAALVCVCAFVYVCVCVCLCVLTCVCVCMCLCVLCYVGE